MLGADTGWWRDAVAPLVAALAGVGGVWIGHLLIRGRELRSVRLTAYVAWMTAVRAMATWVGPEPQPGDLIEIPHRDRLDAFNNASVALQLVASDRVLRTAQSYRDGMRAYFHTMGTQQASSTRDVIDAFEKALAPHRREAALAMRRDLIGGWRRWKTTASDEPSATLGPSR